MESANGAANQCSDESIQAGFDALNAACERPHRSNFYLTCNSDGDVASIDIECDIW